jgi:hypothetical protein
LQKRLYAIGVGMWLALIMAFNMCFIIWPNQQKVLRRCKGRGGTCCQHDLTDQYHALDPDDVLHGGAAERGL